MAIGPHPPLGAVDCCGCCGCQVPEVAPPGCGAQFRWADAAGLAFGRGGTGGGGPQCCWGCHDRCCCCETGFTVCWPHIRFNFQEDEMPLPTINQRTYESKNNINRSVFFFSDTTNEANKQHNIRSTLHRRAPFTEICLRKIDFSHSSHRTFSRHWSDRPSLVPCIDSGHEKGSVNRNLYRSARYASPPRKPDLQANALPKLKSKDD